MPKNLVQRGSSLKIVRNEVINIEVLVMGVLWAWKQKGEIKRREKKTLCFRCYWWHRSRILSRDMWLDLAALMWGHFYLAENKQTITTTHLTFILLKVIEWAYCMIDCIFLLPRPSLSSAGSTGRSDGEYQRRLLWTLLGNKQLQLRILTWSFFNTVAQKSNLKMSLFASKQYTQRIWKILISGIANPYHF